MPAALVGSAAAALGKCYSVFVKVYYMMGKVLTGKLSCLGTVFVVLIVLLVRMVTGISCGKSFLLFQFNVHYDPSLESSRQDSSGMT